MLPKWCNAACRGWDCGSLKSYWGIPCRVLACCSVALHYLAQHCTGWEAVQWLPI